MITTLVGQSLIGKTRTLKAGWGISSMPDFKPPLKALKIPNRKIYKHRTRKGIKTTYIYKDPFYLIIDLFGFHGDDTHKMMTSEEFLAYQLKTDKPITYIVTVGS